jgi:hypothetical protein
VLCGDEILQALERAALVLSAQLGRPESAATDYMRHGITTLLAALEVATGKVTDACYPRHRHEEFPQVHPPGRQGLPPAQAVHSGGQLRHDTRSLFAMNESCSFHQGLQACES